MGELGGDSQEELALEEEVEVEEGPGEDSLAEKLLKDPMIEAYITSQAGWTEDSTKHWSNKRARLLTRLISKCSDSNITTCVEALLEDAVLDRIEDNLKVTCQSQPALCKSQVVALSQFCHFLHARKPELKWKLEGVMARVDEWKVKVTKEDRKREAKLQHKMSDEGFLPSTEELGKFRHHCGEELKKFLAGEKKKTTQTQSACEESWSQKS